MGIARSLVFKIATEQWEFEQIHRLNYKTFVEEIPQHEQNVREILVDQFHKENTYFICLDDRQVVGMIALRAKRPFSLDKKLENLDAYLPPGRSVCEVRLLSVAKPYRQGFVFRGLAALLADYGKRLGYDLAVISGTVLQQKLYRGLGFVPFGPLVGTADAPFQPMYLTLEAFEERGKPFRRLPGGFDAPQEPVNFLPGPVTIGREVGEALAELPVSHRSEDFMKHFQETRHLLLEFAGARRVEILTGTGTFANDAVAAQLSLEPGKGLLLANGEFGHRLVDHARRFELAFDLLEAEWAEPFDRQALDRALAGGDICWLWTVHCETSTGMLNDLAMLRELTARHGVRLCLDCISSLGTVPLALDDVYLASGVSGKGLGAYPGLAMVFYNHEIRPSSRGVPRCLDLGYYAECDGVPFTLSTNLLYALRAALRRFQSNDRFSHLVKASSGLRTRLREKGFQIVTPDAQASPAVLTLALPPGVRSEAIGLALQRAGYFLSYMSVYLRKRNWIQIALMGEFPEEKLAPLVVLLGKLCEAPSPQSV
jgi:aspartate aminotransferase-like enzyme